MAYLAAHKYLKDKSETWQRRRYNFKFTNDVAIYDNISMITRPWKVTKTFVYIQCPIEI